MVLVKELSPHEIERHRNLIREYFAMVREGEDVVIEEFDNGNEKGVYKVHSGKTDYLAAAANRDRRATLLEEYNILHMLYESVPNFFPEPYAHYKSSAENSLGELILMEFLPHLNVMKFSRENPSFDRREFAYKLGKSLAEVNSRTGRYSSDPHDGNILLRNTEEGLDLRFCDAIQFRTGSLEDAIRAILINPSERPESTRFIHRFREGIISALKSRGVPRSDAVEQLEFMREYNNIF